ncbi:MAG: hypothetical protein K2N53_06560, partial [Clostridia bacterium]|nr:hypothetical protein [Clostridia bacterium]
KTVRKSLAISSVYEGIIHNEEKTTLKAAVEKAKKDLEDASDADTVRNITDEMTKSNAPIFTRLYQMAQEEAKNSDPNGDGAIDPDDIIIDN